MVPSHQDLLGTMHAFTSSDRMIDGNKEEHEKNSENFLNAICDRIMYCMYGYSLCSWLKTFYLTKNVEKYVIIYLFLLTTLPQLH